MKMQMHTLLRSILAGLFMAMALLGASLVVEEDEDGSRICVGSAGMSTCVPLS